MKVASLWDALYSHTLVWNCFFDVRDFSQCACLLRSMCLSSMWCSLQKTVLVINSHLQNISLKSIINYGRARLCYMFFLFWTVLYFYGFLQYWTMFRLGAKSKVVKTVRSYKGSKTAYTKFLVEWTMGWFSLRLKFNIFRISFRCDLIVCCTVNSLLARCLC